jgi:hypothetical protein
VLRGVEGDSVYLPYDEPPTPGVFERLMIGWKAEGTDLIIGSHANMHHSYCGSTGIKSRGESLFNYINDIAIKYINHPTQHMTYYIVLLNYRTTGFSLTTINRLVTNNY